MTISLTLKVSINDNNYCQITTNTFQRYADSNLEGKPFWEFIKIDFENWIKEH